MEQATDSWDIKKISIYPFDDSSMCITVEVFSDREFSIKMTRDGSTLDEDSFTMEDLPLDAARRLRDFLNYAAPGSYGQTIKGDAPPVASG